MGKCCKQSCPVELCFRLIRAIHIANGAKLLNKRRNSADILGDPAFKARIKDRLHRSKRVL